MNIIQMNGEEILNTALDISRNIRDLNENLFSLKKNVNKNKTLFNEITLNISKINNFSNSIYKQIEEILDNTPKIPDDILEKLDAIDFEKLSIVEYSILSEAINKICRSQFRAIPEAIQMF